MNRVTLKQRFSRCDAKRRIGGHRPPIFLLYDTNIRIEHCIFRSYIVQLVSYDTGHEKTDLKVFVIVIRKEGWAHPSFGMRPTFRE